MTKRITKTKSMFPKIKITTSLFNRSLGSSLVASALILACIISVPNNFLPDSFPVLFKRQGNGAVLPAADDTTGPIFNPNYILADSTFRSTRDFPNAESVQRFLDHVSSPLATYTDGSKRASDIIFEAARGENSAHSSWSGKLITPQINPALLLTKLETEQSLLTLTRYDVYADKERRIAKAMGYACYDLKACSDSKKGFFDQVTGAAWQLEYNYQIASDPSFKTEPYSIGKTITTLDEKQVYLSNASTAAFYKYTPHVYWGNYNVWKIITVYGWGVSQQKWSKGQIDKLNLNNGFVPASSVINAKNTDISYSSVESLLKTDFNLADKSDKILLLQKFLRQEGYYTQDPSGLFGMVTKEALDNYRKEKRIKADPTIQIPDSAIDKCPDLLSKNYKTNEISQDIRDLQQCLRDRGLFTYATNTGKYATLTRESHKKYKDALAKSESSSVDLITPSSNQTDPNQPKIKSVCDSLYQDDWKMGQVGPVVRQLQQCLIDQKLLNSAVTGRVGNLTIAALKQVKPNNLSVAVGLDTPKGDYDGYVCSDLKKKFYKIGTKSQEISALQKCMTDAGTYKYGSITGLYGYVTDAALVKWKKG